jgi:molybdopterin/thiamine biosynthesis adenylyltransferase
MSANVDRAAASTMVRPAVKRVHRPLVLPDRRIQLGLLQYGVASEIIDDEHRSVERLLELMDGTRDVGGLWSDLRATHPDWSLDDVRHVVAQLAEAGHLEDLGAPLPAGLTQQDVDRYRSCAEYFSWIDTTPRTSPHEVLARIRRARVTLLGLGGVGTAVAAGLVASGIGELRCADFDRVELGNLTRQLLYTESDVGHPKVDRAVARLRALSSTVRIVGEELKVTCAEDVEAFIDGSDAFVLCADEPADVIQFWVNEAALRTSTPWFMAAYTGAMTGVSGFVPGETGCWACLKRQNNRGDEDGRYLFEARPHAVVAASAAVSGHLCALEVLYHLGGLPTQARGRVFQHNLAQWDHQYFLEAARDPHCPTCAGR